MVAVRGGFRCDCRRHGVAEYGRQELGVRTKSLKAGSPRFAKRVALDAANECLSARFGDTGPAHMGERHAAFGFSAVQA